MSCPPLWASPPHLTTSADQLLLQRTGRKKNAGASGVTVAGVAGAAAQAQAQAAAKKDQVHSDFYRFQQREKRRSGELALGWEVGVQLMPASGGMCPW